MRWFAAGIEAGTTRDAEPMRELIDPEFEFAPHITGGHEGVVFRGFEGLLTFIRVQAETWESLRAEPSEMRENGDVVVVLGTIRARGRASGVDVEEPTVWLCRIRGGRILRLEAHAARDPARVAWALAEAGLPPDAFDTHGASGEAASSGDSSRLPSRWLSTWTSPGLDDTL
jgi:ketosteroid isomerase-like protein